MSLIKRTLTLLLCAAMIITYMPLSMITAYAAAGDTPVHHKTLTDNHDGTYKLKLSVTGDADNVSQNAGNVDLVVVYDVSQSMSTTAGSSRYSRGDQAEDVVHDFLTSLAGYSNGSNIRVSLVNFGKTASQIQGWTTDVSGLANRFDDVGTDGRTNFTYNSYGTNWEHALRLANTLVGSSRANVPTFVLLITDGAPTATGTQGNDAVAPGSASIDTLRNRYNAATDEAYSIQSTVSAKGGDFYGIYAYGTEADLLDDLMYFSENNTHRGGTTGNNMRYVVEATEDAPRYFNTAETTALEEAIDQIFTQIVQAMGIAAVSMSDGTTNQVTVSGGNIKLLEVDEHSYQYWMDIPLDASSQFKRTLNIRGSATEIAYTVTDNKDGTCTVTWTQSGTSHSENVKGSIVNNQFKYEWEDATGFYEFKPNDAELKDGAVDWDLSNVGTLLTGVTYYVTFDVYPSQTALDYKARLENGEAYTDVVPAAARQYFSDEGVLETNTGATLTYSDTRLTNPGPKTATFENHPDVTTTSEQMTIKKEWKGDNAPDAKLKLDVLMDGDEEHPFYEALVSGPNWESKFDISCGLIKEDTETGEYKVLEGSEGHDFSFAELDDTQYRWELHAPTVRPMIINGADEPTMLIKEDKANGYDSTGKKQYVINGATYYVDPAVSMLTATNHRRSNLNLKKVVTGDDAPADAEFPFTLIVNNSKADDPSSTDTNSDNYVWFSIWDAHGNYVTNSTVGNATQSGNYYYAKSGANITVKMKAGWNLRFTNLPPKTKYSFTEGTTDGFQFASAENTGADDKSFNVADSTATGTIQAYNNLSYEATFTNNYQKKDIEITKVWGDNNNQDGKRPTAEAFKTYLKLLADGTDVTTANASKLSVEADPDDAAKYNVKWTGLDRYAGGKEITYTVEENKIGGYTTTGSPAKDGGTITNTHTPEKTSITVKKTWVGPEASGGAVVTLKAGESDVSGEGIKNPVTLTKAGNNNTYTWQNLDKYAAGKEIEYTVTEAKIDNYSTTGPTGKGTSEDPFVFTNTYKASGEAVLQVTKALGANSTWPTGKTLTFTLAGKGDAPMPETTTATLSAAGTVSFGKITYGLNDIDKTYTYTITEDGFGTGWTESPETVTATVKVTDAGGGKLNADVTYDPANKTITNTYKASGSATLKVTKALSGAEWPSGKDLTVMVTGKTGNEPMPATTSKTITAAGDVEFGLINFTQADIGKTYTYTITESGFGAGWTATPKNGITATIVVNDNGDGTLNPVVTYTPGATFTNTYSVNPTSITLSASKTLAVYSGNNPPDVKGKYTFTLKEGNTTIDTKSNPDGNGTAVEFADLTYEDAGEHTYTITESGTVPGVTNGTTEYTVVVNVVDNHDGTLTPSVKSGNQVTKFTNTYSVQPGTASLKVNKALTGRKLKEGEFSFTLTGKDGAPTPETTTVENDADGEVAFGSISYTAPGTYEYTIAEVKGTDAKITYDEHKVTATVQVTDDGKGKLVSEVSYEGDTTFKNTYKPDPGEANISVIKELTGRDLEAGEFEFTLDLKDFKPADKPATEDPAVENPSADNPAQDAPAANEPAQEAPAADGPAQDAPAANEPAQEAPAVEAPATNEMDVPIEGTAFKDNSISLKPVAYTEVLSVSEAEQEDEAPSLRSAKPIQLDAKNDVDGNVNFDKIEFDEAGTYTFEIKEKQGSLSGVTYDTRTVKVTVEVTYDEETGTFSAAVKYPANKTFGNSYEPAPGSVALNVDKKLNGRDLEEGEFSFTLTGEDGAPMPEKTTVTNAADGSVTFPAITYKEEGEYKYTIKEDSGSLDRVTYDTHEVKVTVNVTDNKKGKLVPDVSYEGATTFVNTYKPKPAPVFIDPPVQKIIKGSPNKTETYTFMLKADDASYPMPSAANGNSSMTMTIKGTGTKEFGRIYFTEPGEYSYEVSEVAGSNDKCEYDGSIYKVVATVTEDTENNQLKVERKYFKDGVSIDTATFRFENTYESGGGGVDTGDRNDLAGMLGILGASAVGLLYMFFRKRREEDL